MTKLNGTVKGRFGREAVLQLAQAIKDAMGDNADDMAVISNLGDGRAVVDGVALGETEDDDRLESFELPRQGVYLLVGLRATFPTAGIFMLRPKSNGLPTKNGFAHQNLPTKKPVTVTLPASGIVLIDFLLRQDLDRLRSSLAAEPADHRTAINEDIATSVELLSLLEKARQS